MPTHIENIEYIKEAKFVIEKTELPPPSNIPSSKGFIGREAELSVLRKARSKGITSFVLHGLGGVGKTELALKFIEEIKGEFQAHIAVDMQGLAKEPLSANGAKLQVIRAFNPNLSANISESEINNLFTSSLYKKVILFLDNAKDRGQVEPLNHTDAFVVITSRQNFNVTGGFSKLIEQMLPDDARKLLHSIVSETRFEGKADTLADLTGYLPIAMLPLASILAEDATEDIDSLLKKYADRQERLRLQDPNRENVSVEASFDLSYQLLSDELKERWRKLAVFPSDFDLEAMQTVWQVPDGKETRSALLKSNLLLFDTETKRARLHDIVRDYTSEKLSDEECFQAELYHSGYYGLLLASLNKTNLPNIAKFDLERTNIEHGFAWLKDKIELNDSFAQFCGAYTGHSNYILSLRLHFREHIKWLETGLKASQKLDNRQSEGNHLGSLGNCYRSLGEYRKAIKYYEEALKNLREISDRQGEGIYVGNLGNAYLGLNEYRKAIEYYKEALNISREVGDRQSEGNHLGNLGIAYRRLSEYHKAIEYYGEALKISRETDDRLGEGIHLGNLGNAYLNLNEYHKAIEYCEEALKISREIDDRQGEGVHLDNLGVAYLGLGDNKKAKDFGQKALAIYEAVESPNAETVRSWLASLG